MRPYLLREKRGAVFAEPDLEDPAGDELVVSCVVDAPPAHSTDASTPSITGIAAGPNARTTHAPRTHHARTTRGQLVEDLAGASTTIGGCRDEEANAWQVNPTGRPSSSADTT